MYGTVQTAVDLIFTIRLSLKFIAVAPRPNFLWFNGSLVLALGAQ